MNKPIKGLFGNDSVIKVVSVLVAVLIWFLVLDQDNPFEEKTLAVPLTTNQESLDSNNLQITGAQLPTSIDVRIKGRRREIASVTANDFKAVLDLSGVNDSGTKRIKISKPVYIGDQDIVIASFNPGYVNLNFEKIVGKQYPVTVEYTGKLPDGYEIINLKVDPKVAILEELESSIMKVDKVVAEINKSEIKNNKEIIMKGKVVDINGQTLKQFEGRVPLIVTFDLAKKVPVIASSKGSPAEDYYLKEIRCSIPSIRVLGTSMDILNGLLKINTEPIDITGKTESFKTPLSLILPDGLTALKEDTDKLSADVIIEKLMTRDIEIPSSAISIYDSDATGVLEYRVSDELAKLTLKGRADALNRLTENDIKLSVSALGLGQGEHAVPLSVGLPNGIQLVGDYNVKLAISEASKDQTE